MTLLKVNNSIVTDSNYSKLDEIPNEEFKRMIRIMVNEFKGDMKNS
jgi:hypothetical protein